MTSSKVTTTTLRRLRAEGRPAVFVTAYDYPTASYADRAGVDLILVGDSAAMTMLGLPNTLGIGMPEMLTFARAVTRAVTRHQECFGIDRAAAAVSVKAVSARPGPRLRKPAG